MRFYHLIGAIIEDLVLLLCIENGSSMSWTGQNGDISMTPRKLLPILDDDEDDDDDDATEDDDEEDFLRLDK